MATLVDIRALSRSAKVRVPDSGGVLRTLSASASTTVDMDSIDTRRALAHHNAIGQWIPVAGTGTGISSTLTTTQNMQSSLTLAQNKRLTLTSNTPGGGISRLIEFHMTTEFDRPWISWFDETNLHRAAFGYHTTDISEGGSHQAVELKTVAADGVDMRTRWSIGTKNDYVLCGFNYSLGVEINQGDAPASPTPFGLTLRGYKRDGSISQIIGQLVAQVETTDAVTAFLDVNNVSASQPHQLVVFKSANSSSGSAGLYVKRGNGTNTDAFVLKNRTGVFEIGPVATVPSGAATNGRLYVAASGALTYVSPAGTVTAIGPA